MGEKGGGGEWAGKRGREGVKRGRAGRRARAFLEKNTIPSGNISREVRSDKIQLLTPKKEEICALEQGLLSRRSPSL